MGADQGLDAALPASFLSDMLRKEWRPALGCTEPACVAFAASLAASQAEGPVESVTLTCDPRMYKNCFAVGIPNTGHKTGLRWALALGATLPDPSAELEALRQVSPDRVEMAGKLIEEGRVQADVDASQPSLHVDCTVGRKGGVGRVVISDDHTRVTLIERDGERVRAARGAASCGPDVRETLAGLSFARMMELAAGLTHADRLLLREGILHNLTIARHGLSLLPDRFRGSPDDPTIAMAGRMVCAGVYARMWGEDFTVMSLAGSGNKGITVAVPIALLGEDARARPESVDEALALACLVTSAVTHHLGSISAVCGCANAAGIGLAAGVVMLLGGGADEVSMAVTNMVGNVTGIICDGAKIGCALKTMSAVDAAYRAATLACEGVVIPDTDGIVGSDGRASLANLGRIANQGMAAMDGEVLDILRTKMRADAATDPAA